MSVVEELDALRTLWPRVEWMDETIVEWGRALRTYRPETVAQGLRRHAANHPYPPSLYDLRGHCNHIEALDDPEEEDPGEVMSYSDWLAQGGKPFTPPSLRDVDPPPSAPRSASEAPRGVRGASATHVVLDEAREMSASKLQKGK